MDDALQKLLSGGFDNAPQDDSVAGDGEQPTGDGEQPKG
ncbi:hypothetical protein AHiyo4_33140 [Arthrobacter sp. Hiyo4]|nr:hypothetical protein AHiyo4_33140 [Arthrobacter sp. Hiyo4]